VKNFTENTLFSFHIFFQNKIHIWQEVLTIYEKFINFHFKIPFSGEITSTFRELSERNLELSLIDN